jgi:YVTN family beta-propeller protein
LTTDGSFLYTANYGSNYLSYINATNGQIIDKIPVGSGINTVVVTPDGSYLMVTQQYSNTVSLINTTSNKVIKTIYVGNQPVNIGMSYGTSSYQHT